MTVEQHIKHVDSRAALTDQVLMLLQAEPFVQSAELYGSLANGTGDRYADIDLVVQLDSVSDRTFAFALPRILRPLGPFLVEGWGVGFLPDTYIRTFYFSNQPLFWHVDIGCVSDQHEDGSDLKQQYHWPQIFKMWIDVVKDLVRGQDRVDTLTQHIARWGDVSSVTGTSAQRLGLLLDLCAERARSRGAPYEALYERCVELRHEYLE